jgi:hypothetical protein
MLDLAAIRHIVAHTLAHRGGTFDARTGKLVQPTSGYAVAVATVGRDTGALLSADSLYDRLSAAHYHPAPYIGTWVDTNHVGNDVAYVDRVVILPDRESALILARAFNQLAVWDFANGTEVRLAA